VVFYDLIHGYQPYQPPHFIPHWVEENLREVYVTLSTAMKCKSIKRGVQLQGWTIENYLNSPNPIRFQAEKVINNLKEAKQNGTIEIGASGYSHPILPLFTKEIIKLQIIFDIEILHEYVGEPTWFWFPEGAVNSTSLEILYKLHPDLIVTIPDTSFSQINYSDFIKIKYPNGGEQKAVVYNSLLKDIIMNACDYPKKPSYVPKSVDWAAAQNMVYSGNDFEKVLQQLGGDFHVVVRDWEKMGTLYGKTKYEQGGYEMKGLLELDTNFKLISEMDWAGCKTVSIDKILNGSWECDAPQDDPYLYWKSNKAGDTWARISKENKDWVLKWENMIDNYNNKFKKVVEKHGGVENIIKDKDLSAKIKDSFTALLSCVPWHFLTKDEYRPDPGFSKMVWEKMVVPSLSTLEDLV